MLNLYTLWKKQENFFKVILFVYHLKTISSFSMKISANFIREVVNLNLMLCMSVMYHYCIS